MTRLIALFLGILATSPALAGEARPFVKGSWQELRQLHRNKPTIVHFWGVTCAPCMVEMPRWAKLADAGPRFRLRAGRCRSRGRRCRRAPMLAKMGLSAMENWRFADDFADRLRFEIDPKWHGELPPHLADRPATARCAKSWARRTSPRCRAGWPDRKAQNKETPHEGVRPCARHTVRT